MLYAFIFFSSLYDGIKAVNKQYNKHWVHCHWLKGLSDNTEGKKRKIPQSCCSKIIQTTIRKLITQGKDPYMIDPSVFF